MGDKNPKKGKKQKQIRRPQEETELEEKLVNPTAKNKKTQPATANHNASKQQDGVNRIKRKV